MATSDISAPRKRRPKQNHELSGQRFGRLVALSKMPADGGAPKWLCVCDCGKTKAVRQVNLRYGGSRSCGCLRTEMILARARTHGMSGTPIYKAWGTMIERCTKPFSTAYYKYGARGITVCERWRLFENFYADMGPRPSSKHSVDRIDNDGPYSPENCRWATNQQQMQHTRKSVYVLLDGESITVSEASRRTGIKAHTLHGRMARGDSADRLFRSVRGFT